MRQSRRGRGHAARACMRQSRRGHRISLACCTGGDIVSQRRRGCDRVVVDGDMQVQGVEATESSWMHNPFCILCRERYCEPETPLVRQSCCGRRHAGRTSGCDRVIVDVGSVWPWLPPGSLVILLKWLSRNRHFASRRVETHFKHILNGFPCEALPKWRPRMSLSCVSPSADEFVADGPVVNESVADECVRG